MAGNRAIELREYLRRHNPSPDEEFDIFLGQVEIFFRLRALAEDRFLERPHTAKGRKGALPLDWADIASLVESDYSSPPENIITQFTRDSLGVAEELITNLRKVLTRERAKVSLGLVQQVDPHCLRWLTRQPGRDGLEKAGANQRILAVVRRENYNTPENRVFKDFLFRVGQEAAIYLRKNEKRFLAHDIIKRVRRLQRLCEEGIREPVLEAVGDICELPAPNYVLRQDRRYSKIWKTYVELIRQASVAERLWDRRGELTTTLSKLRDEAPRQTDPLSKFHAPIWFNPLDGRHNLLDAPFFENDTGQTSKASTPPKADDVVVDLVGGSLSWDLLIYGKHPNAKPYLQDYAKPSIEDRGTKDRFFLSDLLEKRDAVSLRDYFEQLYARLGGKRWFVLVPDDWDALWQETVIKTIPLARNNIFLIWRSVAAAIAAIPKLTGAKEGEEIVIIDALQSGNVRMSCLTLTYTESEQKLVPQRKSFKHGQTNKKYNLIRLRQTTSKHDYNTLIEGNRTCYSWTNDINPLGFINGIKNVVLVSATNVTISEIFKNRCSLIGNHQLLVEGVTEFVKSLTHGVIAYYDELEALSLIVQTDDENIVAKTLVSANEKWPGGRVMETPLLERAAMLNKGEDHVRLLLCMGDASEPRTPLKIKRHEFLDTLDEDQAINLSVRMTPGQGMAVVTIQAVFLRHPIELDFLNGMSDLDENDEQITIASLEAKMQRSFPPDAPHVVADKGLWDQVAESVRYWHKQLDLIPDGEWFAKASPLYPPEMKLPQGLKPIERLRRKNVFGNDPDHRYPTNSDFSGLFRKLKNAYDKAPISWDATSPYAKIVRTIAWTYQSDTDVFKNVRAKTISRIEGYANNQSPRPLPQEYSLCANLCNKRDEWQTLWNAILKRLMSRGITNSVEEDLRLLYNLLQFHPTFLYDTKLFEGDNCWKMMQQLLYWYPEYNEPGPIGSKRIGYVLKCILYLLRCRKFDGKVFVTKTQDKTKYQALKNCLTRLPLARPKQGLHRVVCEYLDGCGTIIGLPTD